MVPMEYYKLKLTSESQEDIRKVCAAYAKEEETLNAFRAELKQKLTIIEKYPKQHPPLIRKNIRKADLKNFPCMIIYELLPKEKIVVVLAVFHQHHGLASTRNSSEKLPEDKYEMNKQLEG